MKPPNDWPPPPAADELYGDADSSPEMSDEEALELLSYFRDRSLSKGYIMIMPDFEELMQAIYVATTWYYELQGKE